MTFVEQGCIDIWIDEIVPCLRDTLTDEIKETVVSKIESRTYLKKFKKSNGWHIDWYDIPKNVEVYVLALKDDNTVQGLVGLRNDKEFHSVYLHWACVAPHNNKCAFGERSYVGVGGHLFAIAADKSIEWGYEGAIHGFAANEKLLRHYIDVFHAEYLGMLHQYFYPYYKADKEAGILSDEEVLEILESLWLNMAQYADLHISPTGGAFNEGYAHWEAVTVGGQTPQGQDAVNELIYLILQSKRQFPLHYPDLAARIHNRSDERYLYAVAEVIQDGCGFPKLINDEEVVPLLLSKGASFEEAFDYAVSGCSEVRMPNRDTYIAPCAYINFAAALEMTLRNGRMKKYGQEQIGLATGEAADFGSWEDFLAAYLKQQKNFLKQAFLQQYKIIQLHPKHFAWPLGSLLHDLCFEDCRDIHEVKIKGGIDLGFFDFIGFATIAGYSAYFVELSEDLQNDLIARTAHVAV